MYDSAGIVQTLNKPLHITHTKYVSNIRSYKKTTTTENAQLVIIIVYLHQQAAHKTQESPANAKGSARQPWYIVRVTKSAPI